MSVPADADAAARPARVLVVCTGNICRSPLAERLLRLCLSSHEVGPELVLVESAGVRAMVDEPMTPEAARELSALGGDDQGSRARQLTAELVRAADLVLTAERAHRAFAVQLVPRALRYTFTLRELQRLLHGAALGGLPADPGARVRALAPVANARKGLVPASHAGEDDVVDPFRGDDDRYAAATRQLAPAVHALCSAIAGTS